MLMQVKDVTFTYAKKDVPSVSNIELEINEGEVIAVVGRSGCGKTTLGNLFTGVIPGIYSDGKIVGDVLKAKGISIGLISQSPESQLFGYSVEDAILFGLENMKLSYDEIAKELDDVLKIFNIEHLRKRPVEKLSGGQKQSVCIASILAMHPEIIVMDEPVSSLDPMGKALVQEVIGRLCARQQTIILLDQNIEWSYDVITRVIGMEEGRIVFDGSLQDFVDQPELCERLGVTLPPVTEVCHFLQKRGVDVPSETEWNEQLSALAGSVLPQSREESAIPEQTEEIFKLDDIHHHYGDFEALKGVTLGFESGKITAILGQNGCGKTTMIKHLNALLRPSSGVVYFHGKDIADSTVAQLSRSVAFGFQHPDQMLFEESVEREISFSSRMHGKELSREAIEELLKQFDLLDMIDVFPPNLSMGQKHMVSILAGAAEDCEVYIFDEPTLGMDYVLKKYLISLMEDLKSRNKTVILISHELPFVCRVADNGVVIKDGKLLKHDTIVNIFSDESLFEQTHILLPQIRSIANKLNLPKEILTAEQLADYLANAVQGKEDSK